MMAEPSSTPADLREPTVIPVSDWEQSARALLEWLPSDCLQRLARFTKPHVIRQRRLEERDALVRRIAADLPSGREMANELHRALSRYAAGADSKWHEPPADARRAALHRILRLSQGAVPGQPTLRRALAGLSGSKSKRK